MAARSNQGRQLCLTDLPDEVVLEILFWLGARDAARTSVLCQAWRHLWRRLPSLMFGGCSFGRLGVVSAAQSVLQHHRAQVDFFALDGCSPAPVPEADHPRLDDLLVQLSPPRHLLTNLILELPSYKLHSSVSSFVELEHLSLKGCLLPDSTQRFPGLSKLKSLCVHYTEELEPHLNSAQFDALTALISGCPGLKKLAVKVVPEVAGVTLKIAAPRLRQLKIKGSSADWTVEFQSFLPGLAQAKLRLPFSCYAQEGGWKLLNILQTISQVKELEMLDSNPLVQAMAPLKIPTKFENLQYLTTDADLGDPARIVLILHFLRCCPNIRGLKIKSPVSRYSIPHHFEVNQDFWNTHGYGDLFRCLRIMELIDVFLSYNELQFVKFILSKAQVLENFTIAHLAADESSSLEACIEILKFKRVSQVAQIEYKVNEDIKWLTSEEP